MSIENLKTFGKFATFPLPARVRASAHFRTFPHLCTLSTRPGDASAPGLSVRVDSNAPPPRLTESYCGGVIIWYWTEADPTPSQTPSPKPTKIPARPNSLRTISTYGFSVRPYSRPSRRSLPSRLAGAKRGTMLTVLFHRAQWS
jgi:hypothetical protein